MMSNDEVPKTTAPEIVAGTSKDESVAAAVTATSAEAPVDPPAENTEEAAKEFETPAIIADAEQFAETTEERMAEASEAVVELEDKAEAAAGFKMEMPSLSCFDLSTIACCGLGSTLLYNEDSAPAKAVSDMVTDDMTDEEKKKALENEKAVQIQKLARSKLARKTAEALKAEKEASKEHDTVETEPSVPESAPELALVVVEDKPAEKKGGFLQKLAGLFSGCRNSNDQVVSRKEETGDA